MTSYLKSNMKKRHIKMSPSSREFFLAVRLREIKKVKRMLKDKRVGPNVVDLDHTDRPTALLIACEMNDVEITGILLKSKSNPADVNTETVSGRRAIWWAAKHGNLDLAELLLKKPGCDVNRVDKETGCAPLFRAVLSNSTSLVQLLVTRGADVNMRMLGTDGVDATPLIKAVQMNNKIICTCLLNSLCNIQAKTDNGFTALHFAVAFCRYEICELLLETKIKVHAKSTKGVTAMTVAIENRNPAMVLLLIKYGYKPDKKYEWKETPLEQAIKQHSEACAITLIISGARVETLSNKKSYFYMAVNEKLFSLVKMLIDIKPSFLNESWIWLQNWPVAIYPNSKFCAWLVKESQKPKTLRNLCQGKIFRTLGRYPSFKVDKLPVPDGMKDWLKFNYHIKETHYEKLAIDNRECPYDCSSKCLSKSCPGIEISSESEDLEFD